MACSLKNCTLGDNEVYIRCWICEVEYHSKCAGISARVSDALNEKKGVRWSCEKCRGFESDFFQHFKQCRAAFLEISNDLVGVQTKLAKYEDAFKSFSVLNANSLDRSPPKRRKNLRSNNKNITAEKTVSLSLTPQPPQIVPSNEVVVVEEITQITRADLVKETVPPPVTPISHHKDLVVVSPKKAIFLSRFAADTTENDVLFYIRSKIKKDNEILINKFIFAKPRSIASFKVIVPMEIFNNLLDPSFWPKNTVVHEYVIKNRNTNNNVVTLPKNY